MKGWGSGSSFITVTYTNSASKIYLNLKDIKKREKVKYDGFSLCPVQTKIYWKPLVRMVI